MIGHTHNFQISGHGCPEADIAGLSWTEYPMDRPPEGRPTPRTMSGKARTGLLGEGRTQLIFTLHNTAGMSLTGGKAYSFMSGQGCASSSISRKFGWDRENQSGHCVDYWDSKRSTSAVPNHSQIGSTIREFRIHSRCLDRKSATRFRTPGTWTALRDKNLPCAQRSWRACRSSKTRKHARSECFWREEILSDKMARARVYVKYVWRRGSISRHQPMNWRDSIWASDNRHTWGWSHCVKLRSVELPMKENSILEWFLKDYVTLNIGVMIQLWSREYISIENMNRTLKFPIVIIFDNITVFIYFQINATSVSKKVFLQNHQNCPNSKLLNSSIQISSISLHTSKASIARSGGLW